MKFGSDDSIEIVPSIECSYEGDKDLTITVYSADEEDMIGIAFIEKNDAINIIEFLKKEFGI